MLLFPWAFHRKLIRDAGWPVSCGAVQEECFRLHQQQSSTKLDCFTVQIYSGIRVLNKEQK
jgi:hypothetical protein